MNIESEHWPTVTRWNLSILYNKETKINAANVVFKLFFPREIITKNITHHNISYVWRIIQRIVYIGVRTAGDELLLEIIRCLNKYFSENKALVMLIKVKLWIGSVLRNCFIRSGVMLSVLNYEVPSVFMQQTIKEETQTCAWKTLFKLKEFKVPLKRNFRTLFY